MLRRIITLIGVVLIATVSAEEKTEKLDKIQRTLDNIISKAGISFDGEFRSQYTPSKIGGSMAADTDRLSESNEYTSVDFDIKARPNEMIGARCIFRMHENWQNFFSDVANPIFTRWLSIDGNVRNMFLFNVGDFREQFTPLTLYTPEIEILNEPYIFARQRKLAEDELFIGNNDRVLQGINMKFEAEIYPVFNEFRLNLIGSRLRNIQTDVNNGSKVTSLIQESPFSKYFLGANLDMTFLKGINLGATDVFVFDQKNSFRAKTAKDTVKRDTTAQKTNVFSFHAGGDVDNMIGNENLILNIKMELASSSDDSSSYDSIGYNDSTKKAISELNTSKINGMAINIGADIGYDFSEMFGIKLSGSYILNNENFRNDLAQSPSFYGDRIMNVENNIKNDDMYNTFDALYHSVFKFCPSKEATNRWKKSPMMKTSYWRSIQTQDELKKLEDMSDPALQLVYPYGPATANRVGIDGKLKISALKEGVVADLLLTSLKESKAESDTTGYVLPKVSYSQMGGGLKIDISKFVSAIKYPLELSGSFVASGAKTPEQDSLKNTELKSNFINLGLYWKFWKRTAVMFGYQNIKNDYTNSYALEFTNTVKMQNLAVGFEWSITDGANVVASIGQMKRVNEYDDESDDVKQTVGDITLRVKF